MTLFIVTHWGGTGDCAYVEAETPEGAKGALAAELKRRDVDPRAMATWRAAALTRPVCLVVWHD